MSDDIKEFERIATKWIMGWKQSCEEVERENQELRYRLRRAESDARWWKVASWMSLGAFWLLAVAVWL